MFRAKHGVVVWGKSGKNYAVKSLRQLPRAYMTLTKLKIKLLALSLHSNLSD